ncbi:Glycoside hydrolase, superfamily [Moelleriella libera RCEF 2490]|uniref:Glycoside hydrolase, superfamily n=1 Tax=Moelleriella libera RCEF 2490 TaxID=1081109 RepID=A0A168EDF7_9HYPO|nr:Glycoside hydrolase, superfamily [Moelleriella libera RCEF 2490]
MYTNKLAALAAALAIVDQVAALNLFRAEHQQEKRQVIVEEIVYVTVTEDGTQPQPTPAAAAAAAPPVKVAVSAPTPVAVDAAPKKDVVPAAKPNSAVPVSWPSPSPSPSPAGNTDKSGGNTGSTGKSGSSPFSGKRGLAYNNAALANIVGDTCKKGACGWAYNWGQYPGSLDSKYSFVPMLWGEQANGNNFASTWASTASKAIANGAKALMSFNEPDIASQANMSPADAARLQGKYMKPYAGQVQIGAPSVSNSNIPGQGLSWLQSFVDQCKGDCSYDFCNVHWYSPVSAMETLFEHIEKAHQICKGKPVWLTEFAPINASPSEAAAFLEKAIPRLEALDYLHAYSYFMVGAEPDQLMSSQTSLNAVGQKYASI